MVVLVFGSLIFVAFEAGRVGVRREVQQGRDVAVRVLMDEVHPQQQVAIGEHLAERAADGHPVIFAKDQGGVGQLAEQVEMMGRKDDRLAHLVKRSRSSISQRWVRGSRPLVGSSKSSTSGLTASTEASATFFFSPPLRL